MSKLKSMRTLILFVSILVCSSIISSCDSQPKGRIESKFQNYVNKNFGNPKDFIEIASITLKDSTNIIELSTNVLNLVDLDSLSASEFELAEKMVELCHKLPYNKRSEFVVKGWPLLEKDLDYTLRNNTDKKKRSELEQAISQITSLNAVEKRYILKARVKDVNNNIVIKEYEVIDCSVVDSVLIAEGEVKYQDLPKEYRKVMGLVTDYTNAIGERVKHRNKILNLIKEYMIWTN